LCFDYLSKDHGRACCVLTTTCERSRACLLCFDNLILEYMSGKISSCEKKSDSNGHTTVSDESVQMFM
jgi:hypothetical protein